MYVRFARGEASIVWIDATETFQEEAILANLLIDPTIVHAHQYSSDTLKNR